MNSIELPNKKRKKSEKMTLKCYFEQIPKYSTPRKDKLHEIADKCGVCIQTARNWCIYGMKPKKKVHIRILEKITGIKEEYLWKD